MLVVVKRSRDDERVDPCCRRGCACTSFVFPCLSTAFVLLRRHCPHNEPVYSWRSTVYENKPEWAPPRPPHSSLPTVPSISFDLALASCPNTRHRPPRRPHVPRPRSTHPSAARPVHKLLLTSCLPPSSNPAGNSGTAAVAGPPAPDTDSLRRANTVSNPRHQPSASISANSAASSAFHGVPSSAASTSANTGRGVRGVSRFRSGSLSNTLPDPGLVRRASGRKVTKEVVLENEGEGEGIEAASWGKGLSRQSSLPSKRGTS